MLPVIVPIRSGRRSLSIVVLMFIILVPVAGALALIHSVAQPAAERRLLDPADVLMDVDEIDFMAADGVRLSGWYLAGRKGMPPIILCHDLGGSRGVVLSTAVVLNGAGYPILMFDFRRHGASAGSRSTFGLNERLDLLAAADYLATRDDIEPGRLGAWGVGMGAYAVALGAVENDAFVAIALDGLYPDIPAELDRLMRRKLPALLHPLVPASHLLYNLYFVTRLGKYSVANHLGALARRNVLLIAGTDAPDRGAEERALYEALPEGPEGDKNLLELKSTGEGGLYAADRRDYDARILEFFNTYLSGGPGRGTRPRGAIEVLDR